MTKKKVSLGRTHFAREATSSSVQADILPFYSRAFRPSDSTQHDPDDSVRSR